MPTTKGILLTGAGAALVAALAGSSGLTSEGTSQLLLLLGALIALTLSRAPHTRP